PGCSVCQRRQRFQWFRLLRRRHLRRRLKLRSKKWRVCREIPILSVTFKGQLNRTGRGSHPPRFIGENRVGGPNKVGNHATRVRKRSGCSKQRNGEFPSVPGIVSPPAADSAIVFENTIK